MVDALIRVEAPVSRHLRFLYDWFGKRARVFKSSEDGKVYARLYCDASSLFYWIMQYSEEFTPIEPKERVEEIRTYLARYLGKYDSSIKK